ncbi:MAG TPA: bifunctional pyr operon transcriptional regulator/uracil phosphoribosyltransferase PyrR [Polyangia bacterium]|jgi:pyrimidine operon attenuation protein/uracil phosphoribosyltransferase|nr:bifunctional pyr operon transcriptional regulator/uracil phosphoribosyltransferase PyrR [Polyangia bacterium]
MTPRHPPPDNDLVERREILDEAGLTRTLRRIAYELVERLPAAERPLYFVGIRTGGAFLAQRLVAMVAAQGEGHPVLGAVDISLYRDDVFRGLPKPEIGPTELPETIDGRTIILVDDVLFTGRTVRAAMDVLADYGRPRAVKLVALVDRGMRELPIQPDFVGVALQTTARESVRVTLKERGEIDRVVLRERKA